MQDWKSCVQGYMERGATFVCEGINESFGPNSDCQKENKQLLFFCEYMEEWKLTCEERDRKIEAIYQKHLARHQKLLLSLPLDQIKACPYCGKTTFETSPMCITCRHSKFMERRFIRRRRTTQRIEAIIEKSRNKT